jgi:hypothetical protein
MLSAPAQLLPEAGLGDLEGEEGGLREVGGPGGRAVAVHDPVEEVAVARLFLVDAAAGGEYLGHDGEAGGRLRAHARMSAALPAEEEDGPLRLLFDDPCVVHTARVRPRQERVQPRHRILGRHDQPVAQVTSSQRCHDQQIGGLRPGPAHQPLAERAGVRDQRFAARAGQRQQGQRLRGKLPLPPRCPPGLLLPHHGRLLHNHVRIGTAHPDGVHPGSPYLPGHRPRRLPRR